MALNTAILAYSELCCPFPPAAASYPVLHTLLFSRTCCKSSTRCRICEEHHEPMKRGTAVLAQCDPGAKIKSIFERNYFLMNAPRRFQPKKLYLEPHQP